jgi:hypothetical protein
MISRPDFLEDFRDGKCELHPLLNGRGYGGICLQDRLAAAGEIGANDDFDRLLGGLVRRLYDVGYEVYTGLRASDGGS